MEGGLISDVCLWECRLVSFGGLVMWLSGDASWFLVVQAGWGLFVYFCGAMEGAVESVGWILPGCLIQSMDEISKTSQKAVPKRLHRKKM